MGSAAQSFRYARLRRSRPAPRPESEASAGAAGANLKPADSLDDVTNAPSGTANPLAVQPLVVAGLAPADLTTVTAVSGASTGPLQLKERAAAAPAPVDPPVFLERRSRPRNGKSVRALNLAIAAVLLVLTSPIMFLIAVAIRLTSKGPIIYKQVRVGRDRRRYDNLSPADRRAADRRQMRRLGRANAVAMREQARQAADDRRVYAKAV